MRYRSMGRKSLEMRFAFMIFCSCNRRPHHVKLNIFKWEYYELTAHETPESQVIPRDHFGRERVTTGQSGADL